MGGCSVQHVRTPAKSEDDQQKTKVPGPIPRVNVNHAMQNNRWRRRLDFRLSVRALIMAFCKSHGCCLFIASYDLYSGTSSTTAPFLP